MKKKAALIIMDGWGHGAKDYTNAIFLAETPFIESLYNSTPMAELRTDGTHVGLPEGQMGNSEVGHLNIGAGRIVYQDLQRINKAVQDGELAQNSVLLKAISLAKEGRRIHLIGLLSDGGVHSSQAHVHGLLDILHEHGLKDVFVHAFMDGRDTDPSHGLKYTGALLEHMKKSTGKLASMIGRYYAMDRDKRWERVKLAYDLLIKGEGEKMSEPLKALQASYDKGISDEFLEAHVAVENGKSIGSIQEGDVVISFNFRTDRCREITEVLTQKDMPEQGMKRLKLHYFTMTRYDETYVGVESFFTKDNLSMTLGEVVSNAGASQVRIAETEKYPHVTFFFSGGREAVFPNESRIMIPSPKVATYDLQPEMSSVKVTEAICKNIKEVSPDLIILNFANPDMVGHTGIQEAVIKAVEATDRSVAKVVKAGKEMGYEFIIIADHGNAELNILPDGSPHTSHTTNPVPVFYIGDKFTKIQNGILADVAPSLLAIMNIAQPSEMTGRSILA
jgi:2,3-bisphosphoglycerate-independent phosphoglycerate mutase